MAYLRRMEIQEAILKELIKIRCMLEGVYLDTREAKEDISCHQNNKGCSIDTVEERSQDIFNDYFDALRNYKMAKKKYSKETIEALEEFANELYPIFDWQNNIDCVASYPDAEKIRKKYAPNSIKWSNIEPDED